MTREQRIHRDAWLRTANRDRIDADTSARAGAWERQMVAAAEAEAARRREAEARRGEGAAR